MSQVELLIVEDDADLREALVDTLTMAGYHCHEADSGEAALVALQQHQVAMILSDIQMGGMDGLALLKAIKAKAPQLPVLLMTAHARINDAVTAMKGGAVDYIAKPFSPEVLLNQVSRYAVVADDSPDEPVAEDPFSVNFLRLAERVAQSDASVMITGPSGSGKEVLARYIHRRSSRAAGRFIAINCAAIPANMLEATLFGYEKGAFTGAVQACPGKFEQAQGGTLLLDEVTEMDLELQAKLLRVLQEREVERLGGRKTIELDVRVLATSNRELKDAVADGVLREDLYYRLNVFPLAWAALCDRPGDIVPLANYLLARHCRQQGRLPVSLSSAARIKLERYPWPGNVRELDNVIQRALILCQADEVTDADLLLEGELNPTVTEREAPQQPALGNELKEQEYQIILETLKACQGRRKAVAEKLGISPRTLRYKLARMREQGFELPA